jgi:hypothetical protein
MNIRHMMAPLAVTFASLLAGTAEGQTPDSVAFHAGQWGAEFQIGNGFFGAGALHFTSSTHAWLLNFNGSYDHTTRSGIGTPSSSAASMAIDLGTRGYHAFGPRLERLITLGVSFGYSRQSGGGGATTQAIGVGPFVSLGASWLVTPHLGVGAQWRASVSYTHGTASGAATATANDVRVSLGSALLMGQLYF